MCERWCVTKVACQRWFESQPRAPPGGSAYCACHATAGRGPAAPTRAPAPPEGSVYTAPAARKPTAGQRQPRAHQLLQKAPCTAPATRKLAAAQRRPRAPQLLHKTLCTARRPSGAHARTSSSRRLRVLRLPHES